MKLSVVNEQLGILQFPERYSNPLISQEPDELTTILPE